MVSKDPYLSPTFASPGHSGENAKRNLIQGGVQATRVTDQPPDLTVDGEEVLIWAAEDLSITFAPFL